MNTYEITLTREVLREKSAEILADFRRYIEKNDIKDKKNIIFLLKEKVAEIYRNIFKVEYSNMKNLNEANGKLDLAKEILKQLS